MVAVSPRYPVPGWAGQAELARDQAVAAAAQDVATAAQTTAAAAAAKGYSDAATAAAAHAAATLADMLAHDFRGAVGPSALAAPAPWTPATAYVVGPPASFVTYQGSSYACITPHTSTADFDVAKWIVVAAKGAPGDSGGIDLSIFPPAGTLLKATPDGLIPAVAGTDYLAPNTVFDAGTV